MNDKNFWFTLGGILLAFLVYWLAGHPYFIEERIVMFFAILLTAATIIYFINKAKRGEKYL